MEAGLARVTAALDEVTRRTPGYRLKIALENTAGAGHALGRTFAELGALLVRAAQPERLGVCVDTCHLFAAGYDIRSRAGYRGAMQECRAAVGLGRPTSRTSRSCARSGRGRVAVSRFGEGP